jgi:hypothetical protein
LREQYAGDDFGCCKEHVLISYVFLSPLLIEVNREKALPSTPMFPTHIERDLNHTTTTRKP